MHNLVKNFLHDPKQLKALENSATLLNEAFLANPEICYRFFHFQHWHLIYRDANKSPEIRDAMRSCVNSFADGIKCYYSLFYDDRKAYAPKLIELANSVQDLVYLLELIDNSYRKEIVEKMRQVASTDAEKKKANSYRV